VLRAPVGGAVIPEGFNLYQALVTTYRIAVVLDDTDTELTGLWLRKNGFRDYVQIIPLRPVDREGLGFLRGSNPPPRLSQYRRARGVGGVELVIDPDPAVVAGAMEMGITGMLFGHPKLARPEFRPDHTVEPRPWDQLVAQVEYQRTVEPRLG
jgi:hypothetical protein